MAALRSRCGHHICPVVSSSSFFFFFPRLILAVGDWMFLPYLSTRCGLSANLGCSSETCCTRLAGNTGPNKRQNSPSGHHRTNLSGYIFATKAHIDNRKNVLSSNVSLICPQNIVNFGLLAAEICWRVWGTPGHFNGFRVLAALLYGTLVVGVSQTLRR